MADSRRVRDDLLGEIDKRFAWLTDELSDRLVILGNEIVAVKRQRAPDSDEATSP
jgi:hypothetical protein